MGMLLAALVFAPAAVSFESAGEPVSQIVAQLAERSGEELETGPGLEREILVVRFADTPASEAKAQIAWAVRGRWVDQSGRQILMPDDQATRAAEAQALRDKARRLRATLASMPTFESTAFDARQLQGLSDEEKNEIIFQAASSRADKPALAGAAIGQALSEQELMRLISGERIVFSSRPTPLQKPIPQSAQAAVAQLAKHVRSLGSHWPEADKPGHDLVQLSVEQRNGRLQVAFQFFGGGSAQWAHADIPKNFDLASLHQSLPPLPVTGIRIEATDEMLLLNRHWRSGAAPAGTPEELARYRGFWKNWEAVDPVALKVGPILLEWSRKTGMPLVASVSDRQASSRLMFEGRALNLDQSLINWRVNDDVEYQTTGWLGVRPVRPYENDARVPRAALAEWIKEAEDVGEPGLRSSMKLAAATDNDPQTTATFQAAASAFGQSAPLFLDGAVFRLAARIILADASGNEQAWQAAAGRLDGEGRSLAERLFIHRQTWVQPVEHNHSIYPKRTGYRFTTPAMEPTTAFPNGLPSSALLKVQSGEYPRIETFAHNGSALSTLTVEDLGALLATSEYERMTEEEDRATARLSEIKIRIQKSRYVEVSLVHEGKRSVAGFEMPALINQEPIIDPVRYNGPFRAQIEEAKRRELERIRSEKP